MRVWIRNLTKDIDKEIELPVEEKELDKILNPNDEYIIIDYDATVLSPGQYDSIDELNNFLTWCEEEYQISEETLGILSRVLLYHEVIEHVKNLDYIIVDFNAETNGWNCGRGGDITSDFDKGMCLFDSGYYNPFEFEMNEDIHDWIDWESVWINATTEGWHEVSMNGNDYLVHR